MASGDAAPSRVRVNLGAWGGELSTTIRCVVTIVDAERGAGRGRGYGARGSQSQSRHSPLRRVSKRQQQQRRQ